MGILKKLHKWIGLLIGLQVLLWLLSGLVISLLDPAKVSGKQWAAPGAEKPTTLQSGILLEPNELPSDLLSDALSINLTNSHGQTIYRIKHAGGETLVNAVDGSIMLTGKADAEKLARQDFVGDGDIVSIRAGRAPDAETHNSTGDYWRVNFSDDANTSLYISASSGEILERRNSYWRVRDFFWMLHIMDYSDRENFNNPLIIFVALIAIWLGISGFILLFGTFNRHDFHFLNLMSKRDEVVITLIGPSAAVTKKVNLRRGSNLFLSLATHNINLPSICGGGGECGKCRVKMEGDDLPIANTVEHGLIPASLRKQGFRLACQQEVKNNITLKLVEGSTAYDS